MNKHIFILLLCFGFSSCSLLKNNNILVEKPTDQTYNIENKITELNISPDRVSLNSKIKINKEGEKTEINSIIRVKKDSVIWISLKAPLGIEILRTMITPDSIYFMNRIDKTYFVKPISHIKNVVKTDINYFQIQEILFSSPRMLNSRIVPDKSKIGKYISKSEYATYIINNLYRVEKMELSDNENKKLTITFTNYSFFEDIKSYYPKNVYIEISSEENFIANIDFSKIEFNKNSLLSFKIPSSYVKVN